MSPVHQVWPNHLARQMKGGRKQGRQRKRWEDNYWPGVRQVPEGSGEQGKMEKTGCKIICGAPTTLAVKGLMLLLLLLLMMSCFPTIMTYSMLVPYHYVSYLCSASFIGDVKFTFPYDLSSGATPTSCICLHPSRHNPRRCTERCLSLIHI